MFYRAAFEHTGSKDQWANFIIVETAVWYLIWLIGEAFFFDGLVHWFRVSSMKTEGLFYSIHFVPVGWFFGEVTDFFRWLNVLGTGDLFWDWFVRATIAWACTALPILLYKIYRNNLEVEGT